MANILTTVGDLAEEVADILRHDNLDPRIYEWIGLSYAEVQRRAPLEMFRTVVSGSFLTGASRDNYTGGVGSALNPIACIFVSASDIVAVAQYVTPLDYHRLVATGASLPTSATPSHWTVTHDALGDAVRVYPAASGALRYTLIFPGLAGAETPPGSSSYLNLPYHFEHVIVWGAAAIGAEMVRPAMVPVFHAEFEEALNDMLGMMGYHPSAVPVLRSVTSPYGGTGRLQSLQQQFPAQIPQP
jgi:hypothetical protein